MVKELDGLKKIKLQMNKPNKTIDRILNIYYIQQQDICLQF